MNYKAYAGTGDRMTPVEVQEKMKSLAQYLDSLGYTYRGNGSKVPGDSFELGSNRKELYLPWNKFNDKTSDFNKKNAKFSQDVYDLSAKFFPKLSTLKDSVQKIISTDAFILLGENLRDPVKFLVLWTPDGCEVEKNINFKTTGFMAQAIKIACASKIPIFNLHNPDAVQRCKDFASTVEGVTLDF